MSYGTGEYDCGCDKLVELNRRRSLPVIEEAMDCGDGSCGCGCVDVLEQEVISVQNSG